MAEPLVNHFGAAVPRAIAGQLKSRHARFDADAFLDDVLDDFDTLNLMARARRIASCMGQHLPSDFERAAAIVRATLGKRPASAAGDGGMASFFYLPHTLYVAQFGLDHFETSMQLQYELTQLFTAEFSMRAFLLAHPEATLSRLAQWASDDSEHVRRLVSESTRPRLPWAQRLPQFQRDPKPVLALLELLKDDASLYVRRSVANNLNDIGKDNPEVLVRTMKRWRSGATTEREWLIRHALRFAVKAGDEKALDVLGYGGSAQVNIDATKISPKRARRGDDIRIEFTLSNTSKQIQRVLVDFRIHYVKANGSARPKVFKLKTLALAPGESVRLGKTVSLAEMTTRKHYPGKHAVDVLINGKPTAIGEFTLS